MFALGLGPASLAALARVGGGSAPVAAPISAIAADGWTGTMSPPQDLALLPLQASEAGFDENGDATTLSRTLYTTSRIYQAWSALGANTEHNFTADKVALSDFLYSSSTVVGVDTSACPDSPKPVMNWRLPDGLVVGNTIRQRIGAYHRDGMACVRAWASDGTNTSPVVTVSELAEDGEPGDLWAVNEYEVELDISGLANPANITVHCEGYPRLGDTASIRSTADETDAWRFSPRSYRRDTSRAAAPYIILVQSGGSDTTSAVVSQNQAAAYAAPCATVGYALTRIAAVLGTDAGFNGVEIHLGASTGSGWQVATNPAGQRANTAFLTIRPRVGVAKGDCIWTFGGGVGANPRVNMIRYKGLTMVRPVTAAMVLANVAGGHAWIDDCDFDAAGNTTALVGGTACQVTITNSTIGGVDDTNAGLLKPSATQVVRLLRGVTVEANTADAANATPVELYNAVACELANVSADNSSNRNQSGLMVEACRLRLMQSAAGSLFQVGSTGGTVDGFALINLELEYIGGSHAPQMNAGADGTGSSHGIILHCTGVGFDIYGRWLAFYNEAAGGAVTHTLTRFAGNIVTSLNTKHDVFAGESKGIAGAATYTGAWSFLYGVGCQGNLSMYAPAVTATLVRDSDNQVYPGPGSSIGTSRTIKNDPLFANPQHTEWSGSGSSPTGGSGGSDLRLQAGSLARNIVKVAPWTPEYDLDGEVRTGGALCAAGAYV